MSGMERKRGWSKGYNWKLGSLSVQNITVTRHTPPNNAEVAVLDHILAVGEAAGAAALVFGGSVTIYCCDQQPSHALQAPPSSHLSWSALVLATLPCSPSSCQHAAAQTYAASAAGTVLRQL